MSSSGSDPLHRPDSSAGRGPDALQPGDEVGVADRQGKLARRERAGTAFGRVMPSSAQMSPTLVPGCPCRRRRAELGGRLVRPATSATARPRGGQAGDGPFADESTFIFGERGEGRAPVDRPGGGVDRGSLTGGPACGGLAYGRGWTRSCPARDHAPVRGSCPTPGRAVVLVTGTSGTGKSTVLGELARRGHRALDTDDFGWIVQLELPVGPEPVWDLDRLVAFR